MEITKEIVAFAKKSHPLLPSILGFAVKTLLGKVTSPDLRKYTPEMEVRYGKSMWETRVEFLQKTWHPHSQIVCLSRHRCHQ